jgi:hypothetical protein
MEHIVARDLGNDAYKNAGMFKLCLVSHFFVTTESIANYKTPFSF